MLKEHAPPVWRETVNDACIHTYVCTVLSLLPLTSWDQYLLWWLTVWPETLLAPVRWINPAHTVDMYVRRYHHYTFNHTEEILYTASTHLRIKEGNYNVHIKCNVADLRLHPTTHTQGNILIPYRNHSGMYVHMYVGHFMHMNSSTSETMYVCTCIMYVCTYIYCTYIRYVLYI